jgi:hypothetical protein
MIVDPTMPKIKPQKGFLRFDRLFNDAVRSNRLSAVVEVLLRIPLPGRKARRTARKILAERQSTPDQ